MRNSKVILFGIFFLATQIQVFTQDVVLDPRTEKAKAHGLGFKQNSNLPINSIFDKSEVINISENLNDQRNFGKYVEIKTEISYNYKGKDKTDYIFMVYSNLSEISVKIGDLIDRTTIIGYSGGSGTTIYPKNSDFSLYLYTKEMSPYLAGQSKNRYFEEAGIYWWNPLFLFGK